jgi:hypothetical protein
VLAIFALVIRSILRERRLEERLPMITLQTPENVPTMPRAKTAARDAA